jgi:hypothetical protein
MPPNCEFEQCGKPGKLHTIVADSDKLAFYLCDRHYVLFRNGDLDMTWFAKVLARTKKKPK